jgi:hypothetical protein
MGALAAGGVAVGVFTLSGAGSAARPANEPAPEAPAAVAASVRPAAARPADPGFDRYRSLLERNPFAPRLPKPPVASATVTIEKPAPQLPPAGEKPAEAKKPDAPAAAKPPEPPDPLKDWTYSGTVAIGEQVYAVVENKPAKRSQYLKVGDTLDGGMVEHIAQDELALNLGGQPRSLRKSSAFNATPLNAAAGGAAPAGAPNPGGAPGAPPRPGAPGQPPPGAPGGAPTPAKGAPTPTAPVTLPAGVRISAPTAAPR